MSRTFLQLTSSPLTSQKVFNKFYRYLKTSLENTTEIPREDANESTKRPSGHLLLLFSLRFFMFVLLLLLLLLLLLILLVLFSCVAAVWWCLVTLDGRQEHVQEWPKITDYLVNIVVCSAWNTDRLVRNHREVLFLVYKSLLLGYKKTKVIFLGHQSLFLDWNAKNFSWHFRRSKGSHQL